MRATKLRVAFFSGIAIAVIIALSASASLLSALYARQADAFLDDWKQSQKQDQAFNPDPRAWRVAEYAARNAVETAWVSQGADLDRLGRVLVWGWTEAWPERKARLERAIETYRAALVARPQWALGGLRLANTKYRLRQTDEEFLAALQHAEFYAGTRMYVLPAIAELGLRAWDQLDVPTRYAVVRAIQRTVDNSTTSARALEARAKTLNQHRIFCAVISSEAQHRAKICNQRSAR
jgi:hypothetical protein